MFVSLLNYSDNFNASVRKLFMTKENHDCFASIYAMCQEGMTLIKSLDVDLDKSEHFLSISSIRFHSILFIPESMMCYAPKTSLVKAIERAKLRFRIESDGIAVLLLILIINCILYLLILPCLVSPSLKKQVIRHLIMFFFFVGDNVH